MEARVKMQQTTRREAIYFLMVLFLSIPCLLHVGGCIVKVYAQSDVNLLLSVTELEGNIVINGFVPLKSLKEEDGETISLIKIIIINPSGKSFTKEYRQTLAESFTLTFPSDFNSLKKPAAPGLYRLRININRANVWDTKFVITDLLQLYKNRCIISAR